MKMLMKMTDSNHQHLDYKLIYHNYHDNQLVAIINHMPIELNYLLIWTLNLNYSILDKQFSSHIYQARNIHLNTVIVFLSLFNFNYYTGHLILITTYSAFMFNSSNLNNNRQKHHYNTLMEYIGSIQILEFVYFDSILIKAISYNSIIKHNKFQIHSYFTIDIDIKMIKYLSVMQRIADYMVVQLTYFYP